MFSFRTTPLLEQPDLVLNRGKIAVLCNDTSWHPDAGEYIYETIAKAFTLGRVFSPEELTASSLAGSGADALVVDLQLTGDRFDPLLKVIHGLFSEMKAMELNVAIYIIDRFNPSGRQVEGVMTEDFPHRHGLTLGEVANFYYSELNAKFPLHIISAAASSSDRELMPWSIPPMADYCGLFSSYFHSGQYLWKGTNVSCGEGTTRPFEFFGAPFMKELVLNYNKSEGYLNWNDPDHPAFDKGVYLRPAVFTPRFGIHADRHCYGFQLIINPVEQYNSFLHAIRLIRFVADNCPDFRFNDNMEALAGDDMVMTYIGGGCDFAVMKEYLKVEEQKWLRKAKKFLLYDEQLYRVK